MANRIKMVAVHGVPMVEKHGFVMMVQNKWWTEFRRHQREGKHVHSYVKRALAPPKAASRLLFYVTKPVGEIAGHAEFIERKTGETPKMWKEYGHETALSSKEQFEQFAGGQKKISFIRFKDLHEAVNPIPLSNVSLFLGVKRLARSGFYVDKETTDQLIGFMG